MPIISVKVKPGAKHIKIVSLDPKNFLVFLTAKAHHNKANLQLIEVLAKYFKIKPNQVIITSGFISVKKTVVINS